MLVAMVETGFLNKYVAKGFFAPGMILRRIMYHRETQQKLLKLVDVFCRVGSQSRLMNFGGNVIFLRMTLCEMRILMRLYETKSHEISLMRPRYN
jgi:hypothetical protein